MSNRPTPEQLCETREYFGRDDVRQCVMIAIRDALGTVGAGHFATLLAATEPQTDKEVCAARDAAWSKAAAEHTADFTEGFFAGVEHVLGSVKP